MPIAAPTPRKRCAPIASDLQQIKFRQRILVDVSKRDLSTTILGEPAAMPLILAPVGLLGMQHGDGEIHACRAAQAAGIPFTPEHDVDLLDRGRRRHRRQAVLVPALRHEGPRLHQGADRARASPPSAARWC